MIIWESVGKKITWDAETGHWHILYKYSGQTSFAKTIKLVLQSIRFSIRREE